MESYLQETMDKRAVDATVGDIVRCVLGVLDKIEERPQKEKDDNGGDALHGNKALADYLGVSVSTVIRIREVYGFEVVRAGYRKVIYSKRDVDKKLRNF